MSCIVGNWTIWDTCVLASQVNLTSIGNDDVNASYSNDPDFNSQCYLGYQSRNRTLDGTCNEIQSTQWRECAVDSKTVDTYHAIFYTIYGNLGYLWFQRFLVIYWASLAAISSLAVVHLFLCALVIRKFPNISLISWCVFLFSVAWKLSYLTTLNFFRVNENTTYQCLELGVCDCPHQTLFSSSNSNDGIYEASKLIPLQELSIFGLFLAYSMVFRYWSNFPKYFHIRIGDNGKYNLFTKRFTQVMTTIVLAVFFIIGFILYYQSVFNPSIVPFKFSYRCIYVTLLPCLLLSLYYHAGLKKFLTIIKEDDKDEDCEDDWSDIQKDVYRMRNLLYFNIFLCIIYVSSQTFFFLDIYNEENDWIVFSVLLISSIIPRCVEVYITITMLLLLFEADDRHFNYGHPIPFFATFRYWFYGIGIDETKIEYGIPTDIDFILYPQNPYKNSSYFEFLKHRAILKYKLLSVELNREIPLTLQERKVLLQKQHMETLNEEERIKFEEELLEQAESAKNHKRQQENLKGKLKRLKEDPEYAMEEEVRLERIRSDPKLFEEKVILIQRKYRRVTFRRNFIRCVNTLALKGRREKLKAAVDFALQYLEQVVRIQRAWRNYLLVMRLQWLIRVRYNEHIQRKLTLEGYLPHRGVSKYFKTYLSLHEEAEYISQQKLFDDRYEQNLGFIERLTNYLQSHKDQYGLPPSQQYRRFENQKTLERNFRESLVKAEKGYFDSLVFDKRKVQTDDEIMKSIFSLEEDDFPVPGQIRAHEHNSSSYNEDISLEFSSETGGGSNISSQLPSTSFNSTKTAYKPKDKRVLGVQYRAKNSLSRSSNIQESEDSAESLERERLKLETRRRKAERRKKEQEDFRKAQLEEKAKKIASSPINVMIATVKAHHAMKVERMKDALWEYYFVDEDGDKISLTKEELIANNKAHEDWEFKSATGKLPGLVETKKTKSTANRAPEDSTLGIEESLSVRPTGIKVHGPFRYGPNATQNKEEGSSFMDPEFINSVHYNWQKLTIGDDEAIARHNRMQARRKIERAQNKRRGEGQSILGNRFRRIMKNFQMWYYDEDSYDNAFDSFNSATPVKVGGVNERLGSSPSLESQAYVDEMGMIEKEAFDKTVELTRSRKKRTFDIVKKNRSYISETNSKDKKKERKKERRGSKDSNTSGSNSQFNISEGYQGSPTGNPFIELEELVKDLNVAGENSPLKDSVTYSRPQNSNVNNFQQSNPMRRNLDTQSNSNFMNSSDSGKSLKMTNNIKYPQHQMPMNTYNYPMMMNNSMNPQQQMMMNNSMNPQQQMMMMNQLYQMQATQNQTMANLTQEQRYQIYLQNQRQFQMMQQRQMMMNQYQNQQNLLVKRSPEARKNNEANL